MVPGVNVIKASKILFRNKHKNYFKYFQNLSQSLFQIIGV